MDLILESDLQHQQRPVDYISRVLENINFNTNVDMCSNPIACWLDDLQQLNNNIPKIKGEQSGLPQSQQLLSDRLNLDIRMETGTGKTYVYTHAMYKLHAEYGFNKFIILVPSLAIKAGTEAFISDAYVQQHFRDTRGYNTDMVVCSVNAQKTAKGKKFFPNAVREFVSGSRNDTKKIYVLLLNMQLMTGNSKLLATSYDTVVQDYSVPFDGIAATNPVLIMDEPHRFDRDNAAYRAIDEKLKPQLILRFGATFPEKTLGRGKAKHVIKDYENLIYDLNACQASNQNLVKGVAKEHYEPLSRRNAKVKITSTTNRASVNLQYVHDTAEGVKKKTYTLQKGDSLAIIDAGYTGITVEAIGSKSVTFSNGVEKATGEVMDVDALMSSYQIEMLRLAIERHLETERANFAREHNRIKTLALFFIDDIAGYRSAEGKEPYLKNAFEKLLKEEIDKFIPMLDEREDEYKKYLLASKERINECHAGYFAEDNSSSDAEIGKEIEVILHGKKELLSFTKPDGTYNVCRFLFSKWTLKEGWDNPNVFTITKLRSSGSEISKLQEVGRGLRLPVDEHGNRVSKENFYLNYIVDFTEEDFARKLVAEINGDAPKATVITREQLQNVAASLGKTEKALFMELLGKDYIDLDNKVVPENLNAFYEAYPAFNVGLQQSKVKDRNKGEKLTVKIRRENYEKLKELWLKINQRYLLYYAKELDKAIEEALPDLFHHCFQQQYINSVREIVDAASSIAMVREGAGKQAKVSRPITYNEFLKTLNKSTSLPISLLHRSIVAYTKKYNVKLGKDFINANSAVNFVQSFITWKAENVAGRFMYRKCDYPTHETLLNFADGSPKSEIMRGYIGTKFENGTPSAKYLYDALAYDSPLERENIMPGDIDSIVVYGKIP